ncbi:DUF2058 family protein [Glaciecola sp. XM2]|uniref:DUF2058 domain-containing protein n=1 Tax=Glaciecola sp. XM2 TaxID=1914931 RepID=UPI001BDE7A0D|nr:DUF2058 domain-containing protein [Glaciecola sp. XM2]MBT1449706.1 DUF2058 family protein [Glaciecola sp. XM2]
MSSLQDQLLKAGLADKKQAQKAKKERHKQVKAKQQNKKAVIEDAAKTAAEQARIAKQQKDRELAAQQRELKQQKEIKAQVINLIKVNAQPKNNGDVVLNFTDNNKVKRLYVSERTHKDVTAAKLAIVSYQDNEYELVPLPVADKIQTRMPQAVIYIANTASENRAQADADDDWYADYDIPDDLMW